MAKATVILFKDSGKYYTEEEWEIPEDAIGPYDMWNSPDFRRISGKGAVLIPDQEPWGYPHLFPGESNHLVLNNMMNEVAAVNKMNGWFEEDRSFGEDIALLHSEVSEAFEGYRNGDTDNVHEEMADILIRLLDTCYRNNVDLYGVYRHKVEKNRGRGYRHGGKVV